MLRHSLEVGLWSLQQTEGKLIRGVTAPQQRHVIEPRWRLAVFLAGICHDLGKVVTDLTVTDRASTHKWHPYHQSIYAWASEHSIKNYFLHWQEGRSKNHTHVSSTLIDAVIPRSSFDWISDGSTDAVIWLTESLNNNPGHANQIHDYVMRADQLSVERDLKSLGVAMAGYEIGVPVERYLTDVMRRLVREGIWRINEPSARVWNIAGTTYLVWPSAGEEIAQRIRDEDIPGLPKSPDGILDMMVERGIASMQEGEGDPFFYLAPDVLTEKIPTLKLKAIRLRDQALIRALPITPVAGHIAGRDSPTPVRLQNAPSTPEPIPAEISPSPVCPQDSCGTPAISPVEPASQPAFQLENAEVAATPPPLPNIFTSSVQHDDLAPEPLTGAMGEMLTALIDDFKSGKKCFNELAVKQDRQLCLKWPAAFEGYGFSPKQILDGLTERGWMEAYSESAKVGKALFSGAEQRAIKLSQAISTFFDTAPLSSHSTTDKHKSTTKTTTADAPPISAANIQKPRISDSTTTKRRVGTSRSNTATTPKPVDPTLASLAALQQAIFALDVRSPRTIPRVPPR
jgi:conjugal transfer pilus assembly protein TraI